MEQERKDEWTGREASLLKLCGIQKRDITSLEREIDFTQRLLVRMVKEGRMSEEELWTYMLDKPLSEMVRVNSEAMGIKSKIETYMTQKGETYLAHFTIHGHYLRRVKPGDEEPTYYTGWFPIRLYKEHLEIKMNPDAKMLRDFFVGKGVEHDYDSQKEVAQRIAMKKSVLNDDEVPLALLKKVAKLKKK